MTLTDPREALADQSDFIGYLVGLAGLSGLVHTLASDSRPNEARTRRESDDFVDVLVGLASLGAAIERLANSTTRQHNPVPVALPPAAPPTRWLR